MRARLFRDIVGVVSVSLVATMLGNGGLVPTASAAPVPVVAAEDDGSSKGPLTRPDATSAMVTAQASGKQVEDLSQGDEFTRVFANPDGSWTADTTSGAQRARDDAGEWAPVDTTLVVEGDRVVATNVPVEVSLSAGGDHAFATAVPDGGDASEKLTWRWPSVLPEPVLDGATATYEDAVPGGGDLVVTATPDGFTHNIVLHEAPTLDVDENGDPVAPSYVIPVVTPEAAVKVGADDSIRVVDTKGAGNEPVVSAAAPVMWDSSNDPADVTSEPAVEQVGVSVEPTQTSAGTPVGRVELTPAAEFLTDPATVYPVTIDPTWTLKASVDTWVSKAYQSSQSGSTELRAGSFDAGVNRARSYLKFAGDSTWDGTQILSAKLIMRNFSSSSCANSAIYARRVVESWTASGISWTNQPASGTGFQATYAPGHGGTNCDPDNATWNLTGMVQDWADGFANNGIRISAANESDSNSYRKYLSLEHGGSNVPRMVVTYNRPPKTPTRVTASPVTAYAPPSGTAATYTSSRTPKVSAKVADPDGSKVGTRFNAYTGTSLSSSVVGTCTTGLVAQNTTASCVLSTLPNNTTIYLRAKSRDEHNNYPGGSLEASTGWSAPVEIRVGATVPTAPVVSCPTPYVDGAWEATAPAADVECTITATGTGHSAPGTIEWFLNGVKHTTKITPSSDPGVARTTVTVPKKQGGYAITTTAISQSGLRSTATSYGFGYGPFALTSPLPRAEGKAAATTADRIRLSAQGPANTETEPTPVVKWRVAGSGEGETSTEWTEADLEDYEVSNPAGEQTEVTAVVDTTSFQDADGSPDLKRPVLLDIQLCLPYPSGEVCTWAASPTSVLRTPHAFGGNYPVTTGGPAEVALWTGELSVAETDVTEPGFNTSLSISRTHTTYGGLANDGPAGVFGSGWTAHIDGPGTGFSGSLLLDSTADDGVLVLADPSGELLAWAQDPIARRTGANLATGPWLPVDEDTELSGVSLKVTGTGAATKVTITDDAGVETVFGVSNTPAAGEAFEFTPVSVTEADDSGTTTFAADGQGRVTQIRSHAPAVTCTWANANLEAGCHRLELEYGTSGDETDRLVSVTVVHGATTKLVATYDYDNDGRLTSVTDERTGLATAYGYDGTSQRLAAYTLPGLKPFRFGYTDEDKIKTVTRDNPTGSGYTDLAQIRYNIPRDATGLPTLDAEAVDVWAQAQVPTYAAAVFPQGAPSVPADSGQISAAEWKNAELSYTDNDGRALNTATHGRGRWLLTATDYDEHDNQVRELGEGDIAAIQDGLIAPGDAGTLSVYGAVKNTADEVTVAAGALLTETFETARAAVVNTAGDVAWVRSHTTIEYDQGAPNAGLNPETETGYGLVTSSITRPYDVATETDYTGADVILSHTKTGYDPTEAGDPSGWELGTSTSTTTVMPAGQTDITARSRYDAQGRLIETRQPASNGADAGTRQTIYYSSGANTADTACGDMPAWAGLECVTRYAAGNLPDRRTTSYNDQLQPLEVTETVAGVLLRTVTNVYDSAGRELKNWTKTHGMSGSVASTGTAAAFDPNTGLRTSSTAVSNAGAPLPGETIATGYDAWGRETSYEPTAGETTTTAYNTAGQVASVTDPRGTTTYTYDGTDADGNEEHRGLPTKVSTTRPNADPVEFTGAYDADGTLVTHKLPGGLTQRTAVDTAGNLTDLVYTGRVYLPDPADPEAEPTPTDDMPWVGWSQQADILGRTIREWTPQGAAYTGQLAAGTGTGYSRAYTYD